MRKKFLLTMFSLVLFAFCGTSLHAEDNVAKVGNTEYATIDEAIANWTNGSTLTLMNNVTLSDVVKLKSTEHHILNLGTYTMTAASGKHAIEITCEGRSSASYAITVNADATNPGGITATGKSCIYYKKSGSTKDRPIILINNGVFTGSYSLNLTSNGNTNCPQIWINGGIFNSYMNLTKCMLKVSGGVFHGAINCTGDSSAYREIKGGRFKSWQFMTADADNKFWVGTSKATYDVGVYVDDEGYLVVGGPVITALSAKYKAKAKSNTKWSSYLKYSSAATYGLYYTSVSLAGSGATVWENADAAEAVESNEAVKNYKVQLPENVAKFEVELTDMTDSKVIFDVEPQNANGVKVQPASEIIFRLPVPATWAGKLVYVYHDGIRLDGTYVVQSGNYVEVTSASFSEFAVELVPPTGSVTPAFTGEASIWGEGGGNATESLVVKLYSNEILLATASLNNINGIIDGDVYVSWNIPLNSAGNDEYWNVVWSNYVTAETMPTKVVIAVDGVEVAENNYQLNYPDDLNKIDAATAGADGKFNKFYTTFNNAVNAAQDGETVVILKAGTYALKVKNNITITGAVEGVEFANIGAFGCNDANVTFNNVTFTYANNSTYKGLQHSGNLVYNNCTFNGQVFLYGTSETFNSCTFTTTDKDNYNVWTYSAGYVAFNECTFNCAGKSVFIYHESASVTNDVAVAKCQFVASQAVEGKAAIEMDSSLTGGINLTIDRETTATGFGSGNVSGNSLWNNKKGNQTAANNDITVTVDEVVVLKPIVLGLEGTGTEADPYLINNLEELVWFRDNVDKQAADGSTQYAGKYIKLTADIDLDGINWNPIGSRTGDHNTFKGVFDGDGHTISNLYIEREGEGLGLFANTTGNAVIKNLTINNVYIKSTNNSHYAAAVVARADYNTKITNVHVTGDVYISGRGYIGGIAGHGYVVMDNVSVVANEGGLITSTFWCAGGILGYAGEGVTNISNAKVEGLTVTSAAGGLGAIVGMAEDNNGTQPISGSNLSAKNVEIKTYVGGYGTAYEEYALGYLYGGNPTSKLTGTLSVENVTITTASGNAPSEVSDAVATVGDAVYFDFATAMNNADSKTITLLKDVVVAKTFALNGKTFTLNGNGKTISQAETCTNNIALFDINGGNVTIKNVTFDGVKGVAVVRTVDTEFSMDKVTAVNCQHTVGEGLFRLRGQNTITNSTFKNNNCTLLITLNFDGEDPELPQVIDNCLFDDNTANSSAIVYYVKGSKCDITNSEFVNNKVNCNKNGATIYLGFQENCTVTGNLFEGNVVKDESESTRVAGAIFFGYEANVSGNVFQNNTASNANGDVLGQVCTSTYYDCTIDLSANYWGGEAPVYGKDYTIQHQTGAAAFELNTYYSDETLETLETITYAAKVGKLGYATIKEAVAAVKEGETITILAGTHSEGTIKFPATLKNVTLKGVEGAILKDMTISAADGNSYNYVGLTFDGITFDNSRLLFTGWRNGDETIENLTVTNCKFINLYDTTNTAPVHINKDASEAVKNFTFTNNVIDGATGGQKSGIYAQVTGNVVVENNVINNVSFRPYVIQVTTDDGIADNFTVKGNTFSGSAAGRAQGLGNNAEGTDDVTLVVSNNIFKNITNSQQICYWNFNAEKTTADLSGNYYDIDIVANPGKIYYNAAAANIGDLVTMDIFPIYTALNEDGTIDLNSAFTVNGVSTKAELNAAIASAEEGAIIVMIADIDYGTDQLAIAKAITLDLGGNTLTTRNPYGGMSVKGNPTIKNGTIVHASNTAAIKVWNATAFEDLVIDVQGKGDANKTIGGIVLQSGSTTRVGSIKNVTIKGAALTNGIETYNCGDATENVIGAMENVTINAQGTGMLISAPCGTATNCSISGGTNGIEIWIKGNYSASLNLVDCDVVGGVFAHDELSSNPDIVNNGTLSFTADEATAGASVKDVTLTIARAENVEGVLAEVIEKAEAKIGNTYYITLAKAIAAAKAGDVVKVFAGEYAQGLTVNKAITVQGETDAEDNNLVTFNGKLSITADDATVKNINFTNSGTAAYVGAKNVTIDGCSLVGSNGLYQSYTSGLVTFKNSYIKGGTYGIHFDGNAGGEIVVDNCTVIGWTSFAKAIKEVTITDTKFENGNYNFVRLYQEEITINNCTFNENMMVDLAVDGAIANVNDCTVEGGRTVESLFYGADIVNSNIYVDEVLLTRVAKVGDNYYATLQEAFAAIGNGAGKTVELLDNVDLAGQEWTPIGTSENPFNGNFDGQNHTIKNLNIVVSEAKEGKAYIGLFGYAKDVNIKNVVFENVNLNIACLDIDHSQGHIGAVAGSLEGTSTIENVTVKGDITVYATQTANGASRVAVVAGGNTYGDVTMKNVHVIANEGSSLIANNNAGALAGQLQGKMYFENCSSNIDVTVNKFFAGGLIGIAAGDSYFKNCHTTGNVAVVAGREGRANDHYRVGGIAGGWADGKNKVCTLVNCSYEGAVSGKNADGSVAGTLDYDGYVGRGYTLTNCAGSKVVIDDVEHVQVYDDVYGFYKVGDVYEISSLATLKAFRDKVNAGDNYNGKTVVLTADINFIQTRSEESNWTPIGTSANPFKGTFDGQGHTISNLVINGGSNSNQGFFGTTQNGEIKNVTFNNAKVSGRLNVGVVAGQPYTSKYTNVNVTGHVEVNGMAYVGGVGGKNAYANWTDITVNVDATSYVKANSVENGTAYRTYVGGVVGFNGEGGHTFKNISSNIKVIGSTCDIGGVFGIAHYSNKFENITFTGAVEAPADAEEVGGIAGVWHNEKGTSVTFTGCTSTGTVTIGEETTTGSIVGAAYNAANETADNSGKLIIDGEEVWLKVAKVDGIGYRTLAAAIEAAEEDATVTVISDINLTSTVTIPAGKVVTLDLNGKTISAAIAEQLTKSFAAIQNKGTLTVKDSATTRATGKITVSYAGASFGYGVGLYTISNEGGTLNIESGIVENTTTVSGSMYDAIDNNSTTGNTVLNILGGEVKCQYIGVRQFANSTTYENIVNVTAGRVEGGNTSIWMQNPGSNQPKATIAISDDAYITGRLLAGESTGFVFNVTGGTFTTDVTAFCADNFSAVQTGPNAWVVKQTAGELTRTLPQGWSWFSSYVNISGAEGLTTLEDALRGNGVQIKDEAGKQFAQYSTTSGWYGNLTEASSTKMYSIRTSAAVEVSLEGEFFGVENYEPVLRTGWNYISYPHHEAIDLATALRGFTPVEGDVIKSKKISAIYTSEGWFNAFELNPGEGFMYRSNAANKQVAYTTEDVRSTSRSFVSEAPEHWTADATQYPGNMTMIATLDVEGADYEVAAFVDGEVRGSARPIYVDFLDQYIVVMTINGEDVANVTFKYYDLNAAEVYDLNNVVVYSDNAILGSIESPYALTRGTTGIDESSINSINIYPNPTTTDREINLQATCDKVEVFNTLGVKVAEYQNVDSIDALETAGTYVIRVTLNGDVKHCRLIVK